MHADEKEKFVRNGAVPANSDVRLYDVANLIVSTTGGNVGLVGKFWVEYDVTLFTPQIPAGGFVASGALVGAGTLSQASPMGTAALATGGIGLNCPLATLFLTNLVIGSEYVVTAWWVGTVLAGMGFTGGLVGLTLKNAQMIDVNAAATKAFATSTYIATASSCQIPISGTSTTITSSALYVATLAPAPSL
jgi:hypothetical protein